MITKEALTEEINTEFNRRLEDKQNAASNKTYNQIICDVATDITIEKLNELLHSYAGLVKGVLDNHGHGGQSMKCEGCGDKVTVIIDRELK